MKKRILLSGFILIIAAGVTALKAEYSEIEGAFGQKLGGIFNLEKSLETNLYHDINGGIVQNPESFLKGREPYFFKPTKELDGFDSYGVLVTPISHKIYRIYASGYPSGDDITFQQRSKPVFQSLLQMLTGKYGSEEESQNMMGALFGAEIGAALKEHRIRQENRTVTLSLAHCEDGYMRIMLIYTDLELKKQAEDEEYQLKTPFINKSGL